jgi:hypothetical protein
MAAAMKTRPSVAVNQACICSLKWARFSGTCCRWSGRLPTTLTPGDDLDRCSGQ